MLKRFLLGAGIVLSLTSAAYTADDSKVVAKVNGQPITQKDLDNAVKMLIGTLPIQGQNAEKALAEIEKNKDKLSDDMLDALIAQELVKQAAEKSNIKDKDEVKEAIRLATQSIVSEAYLQEQVKKVVTEETIRKEYDDYVKTIDKDDMEVKLRHVLTKTEAEAKAVLEMAQKGTDFLKLAREKSLDKPSAQEGGDLGYIPASLLEQHMPELAAAAKETKPGQVHGKVVKSNAGYHVIKIDDKRKRKPEPFEKLRRRLESRLVAKETQALIKKLRDAAQIERMDGKDTSSKEAPKEEKK